MQGDIAEIEAIQEETGITNYHPYKKALSFLYKHIENLKEGESKQLQNGLELYDKLYKKYKSTYQECILRHFTLFQLLKDDCKTDDTIFFASTFSKPISPSKLEDGERKYRVSSKKVCKVSIILIFALSNKKQQEYGTYTRTNFGNYFELHK